MTSAYIVNYGFGNVGSIQSLFKKFNLNVKLTENPDEIRKSDLVILPGVGSFGAAKNSLDYLGLSDALKHRIESDQPTLGICLGFQLLTESSEESNTSFGLGVFPASTIRMGSKAEVGWRETSNLSGFSMKQSIYFFNHTYGVLSDSSEFESVRIPGTNFISHARLSMLVGVQFHPEKSQESGSIFIEDCLTKIWRIGI